MTTRTALLLLVSLALSIGVDTSATTPAPAASGPSTIRRSPLRRLLARLGGTAAPAEPSLAHRRLAVPPPELELEVAAAREQARTDAAPPGGHAVREQDDDPARPRWVRRLDEWSGSPRSRPEPPVAFDDGWDPPSAGAQPDAR